MRDGLCSDPPVDRVLDGRCVFWRETGVEAPPVLVAVVEAVVEDDRRASLGRDLQLEIGEGGAAAWGFGVGVAGGGWGGRWG